MDNREALRVPGEKIVFWTVEFKAKEKDFSIFKKGMGAIGNEKAAE